jgi:hypothetical protein
VKALLSILLVTEGCLAFQAAQAADNMLAETPALASTCTQFRARLAQSIAKGGNKVVVPEASDKLNSASSEPNTRFEFHNIAGLDGDVVCDKNDRFESIGMKSKFELLNADGIKRFYRLQALATAALCAEGNFSQQACADNVSDLFASARRAMADDDLRGEQDPVGDARRNFPYVEVEVEFRRGEIRVGVSAALK